LYEETTSTIKFHGNTHEFAFSSLGVSDGHAVVSFSLSRGFIPKLIICDTTY